MLCYNTELLEFPQQNSMCQIFLFSIANLKLFDAFLKAHFLEEKLLNIYTHFSIRTQSKLISWL